MGAAWSRREDVGEVRAPVGIRGDRRRARGVGPVPTGRSPRGIWRAADGGRKFREFVMLAEVDWERIGEAIGAVFNGGSG
jgi:hypothetical protein